MKKAVIYPFSHEHMALLRYLKDFHSDIIISSVAAPSGSGLCGQDAGWADARWKMDIHVSNDIAGELDKTDVLLVPFINKEAAKFIPIYETMEIAANMGKDIISYYPLTAREKKQISILCRNKGRTYVDGFKDRRGLWNQAFINIREMPVPVIFVGGIFAEVNHMEIVVSLAKKFRQNQLKVSAVGIRPEYNLFGFHYLSALADFVHGKTAGNHIETLIIMLNNFLYNLIVQEHLDILIVDVPGGMIDTPLYPNASGVFAYLLSQVLKPDYMIGTTLYAGAKGTDYMPLVQEIDHRFGFALDCIHMSNQYLDTDNSEQNRKMDFGFMPIQKAWEKTPMLDGGVPCFSLLEERQLSMVHEDIIKKLGVKE